MSAADRDWLEGFTEGMRYPIRTASLSLSVRTLAQVFPVPLEVRLELGAARATLPLAVRQLLKLALVSPQIALVDVAQRPGDGLRVWLRTRAEAVEMAPDQLGEPLITHLFSSISRLLTPGELGTLLGRLTFSTAAHETQRMITSYMLRTDDLDEALYIMLSGVTSGDALGFNRAAFFRFDEASGVFQGALGIGPFDAEEASRVWEELEVDDRGFEALLQVALERRPESRFNRFIQSLTLRPEPGDAVSRLLDQAEGSARLEHAPPRNTTLARLKPRGSWLLAEARAHGRRLGLVFTDNRFNLAPIRPDQVEHFHIFTQQSALVWENLALRKSVERQARYDALTGALNRRAIRDELERLDAARRPCALLVVDLDHFKAVNDTHGHGEGDRWLRSVAGVLHGEDALVGRYGGDEFVVLLPDADGEALESRVRRVGEEALAAGISLSIGGATCPADCETLEELFPIADRRLYEAKRAGRCQACLSDGQRLLFARP